jgi:hypothetical protein
LAASKHRRFYFKLEGMIVLTGSKPDGYLTNVLF